MSPRTRFGLRRSSSTGESAACVPRAAGQFSTCGASAESTRSTYAASTSGVHVPLDVSICPAASPAGDAAGQIATSSGTWTPDVEAAYVERVLSALAPHVENWPAARGTHAALSPVELERRNPNLVRGDIYSG